MRRILWFVKSSRRRFSVGLRRNQKLILSAAKTETSMPVLYYVRHGETDLNTQGRLQGRRDTILNAHGRQQAAECGALLKNLFARDRRQPQELEYVSSPLKR